MTHATYRQTPTGEWVQVQEGSQVESNNDPTFNEDTGMIQGGTSQSFKGRGIGRSSYGQKYTSDSSKSGRGPRRHDISSRHDRRHRDHKSSPYNDRRSNVRRDDSQNVPEFVIWGETKTADGKIYYYNKKTREVSWMRPEGRGVIVVKHRPALPTPTAAAKNGYTSRPPETRKPSEPQKFHGSNTAGQANTQLPINIHAPPPGLVQSQSWVQPTPTPIVAAQTQTQQASMAQITPMGPMMNFMPYPLNYYGGMSAGMIPTANPMPTMPTMPTMQVEATSGAIDNIYDWSEHISPDGKSYYFNARTQVSVWEKPAIILQYEAAQYIAHQSMYPAQVPAVIPKNDKGVVNKTAKVDVNGVTPTIKTEKKKVDQSDVEKCKPLLCKPVPGTHWCVVLMEDRRIFFHNLTTKNSAWERPQDLKSRFDVDEILKACCEFGKNPTKSTNQINKLSKNASSKLSLSFKDKLK